MDKAIKFAIIVGVLLAGSGVFYHYMIFLPDLEQRKVERELAERQEAAQRATQERQEAAVRDYQELAEAQNRKIEREIAYNNCLGNANKNYIALWASECIAQAKNDSERFENCILDPNLTRQYCESLWRQADPRPNCALPIKLAESLNTRHEKAKQQCLAEAKLF